MRSPAIRVKAYAVLLNGARDAHLVWRGSDPTKDPTDFHRLLGGHVEFGEAAVDAVVREVREETGLVLEDPELLGVLEERFTYQGQPGHEIVFVYTGRCPAEPVPPGGGWLDDNGRPIWVEWRPVAAEGRPPLYPVGVQALLDDVLRRSG